MAFTAAGDPMGVLGALVGLAAAEVDGRPTSVLADDLRALQEARNRVDAEFVRRLAVFDARGGAGVEHAASTQSWLRGECRLSASAAAGHVRVARRVYAGGSLAGRLADGDVSYQAAVVVATAVDKLPEVVQDRAESFLARVAAEDDVGAVRRAVDTVKEMFAPDVLVSDAAEQYARRYVNVSETFEGMVAFDGMLDREGGAIVLAAVQALATPLGPEDNRTAAQRRADGFVEAVRVGLDSGQLPEMGGERPHVTLTVDFMQVESEHTVPVAHTDDRVAIVGQTVHRILCDSRISRVVVVGNSEVLDVGRATRTVPAAIRRALWVRDRGCKFPGCHRPPKFTDAHHVVHWAHGGATSVDNLVLLCRFHHRLVHEGGWQLVPLGTDWRIIPADRDKSPPHFAA